MESRFGADFGRVRVHGGSDSQRAARAIDARAFTYGHDIFLGPGKNDFSSVAERRLLAHELTHVIQQTGRTPRLGERQARPAEGPRISSAPLSLQRYSWDEFKKDAGDVASSVVSGVSDIAGSVASAVAPVVSAVAPVVSAAAPVISAVASAASAAAPALNMEELLANWQRMQVDWSSPAGMTLRGWASRLDPDTARQARAAGPSGLFSVISIPDDVKEAATELGRNARMDFEPRPLVDPRVTPFVRPPVPGPPIPFIPKPPAILVAILIFLAILLWPNTTPEKTETDPLKKGEEQRKREAEEQKKEREKERGRCRETIPALRTAIHATVIGRLDRNAGNFLSERLGDTPRTREDLGRFFLQNEFFFSLAIVKQTKNTILKVCSVANNTLAANAGNKDIGTTFHAEEIAAPGLSAQLQPVPVEERTGATLFNVCQSRACAQNARNPDGCTAVLEQIRNQQLPGGEVVDEPTGFPSDIKEQSSQALLRALQRQLPNP